MAVLTPDPVASVLPTPPAPSSPEPFVFLGIPTYDAVHPLALDGMACATEKHRWHRRVECTSLLPQTFNLLWIHCLNNRDLGFTHFAMMHADISAEPGWLDILLEEMERVNADVIGAIAPIKDNRGVCSVGWMEPEGRKITRFTIRECHALPETFDAAGCGHPNDWLMLNTGLWIAKLGPWVDDFPGFAILSGVRKVDGMYKAAILPEDWNWSAWMGQKGLRTFLTRKVKLTHYNGMAGYSGAHEAWGAWETDLGDNHEEKHTEAEKEATSAS